VHEEPREYPTINATRNTQHATRNTNRPILYQCETPLLSSPRSLDTIPINPTPALLRQSLRRAIPSRSPTPRRLDAFQTLPYDHALARQKAKEIHVDSWDDYTELFKDSESSFVWAHWDGTSETELAIKDATKATTRCIPYAEDGPVAEPGVCIKTGNPSAQRVLFSKNY
jgi:hypothetical protein